MDLSPLATAADLPAAYASNDLALAALQVASSAIRDAAGAPISPGESTVTVSAVHGQLLRLPGIVRDVSSVVMDGQAVTDYIVMAEGLWRDCGWGHRPVPVVVTYTHGHSVPEDIVHLCAQLAVAYIDHIAAGGGSLAGVKSVSLDDASETYTDEAAALVSPAEIQQSTRRWLRARFGGGL